MKFYNLNDLATYTNLKGNDFRKNIYGLKRVMILNAP